MLTAQGSKAVDANFHHFVMDIAWFGLGMAATSRFLQVFAIRLGAGATELGLLSALPALLMVLSASVGLRWLRHHKNTIQAIFWPSLIFRLAFVLPVFAPLLPREWQAWWIVASATLPALGQGIAGVVFVVMFRETIPPARVNPLLGSRALALNIGVAITAVAFGVWLESAPFPMNYQAMYLVAFICALISMYHLLRLRIVLPTPALDVSKPVRKPWRAPEFRMVGFVILVTHIAYTSILPLIPLYLVRNMGASEGFIALFGLVELAAGALVATQSARIIARVGMRQMIGYAMVGTAIAALAIAFAPSLAFTLIASALMGASWTAIGVIGMFGYFNEQTRTEDIATFTPAYQQLVGLSMFIGPLIGSFIIDHGVTLAGALVIGAAMRLAAGLMTEFPPTNERFAAWRAFAAHPLDRHHVPAERLGGGD